MEKIYYIDGGCSRNGSPDARGIAVATDSKGSPIFDVKLSTDVGFKKLKPSIITNNVAEFEAFRRLVYELPSMTFNLKAGDKVTVFSDSEILVKCANAEWTCKQGHLAVILLDTIFQVLKIDLEIELKWLPREDNLAGIYIENKYKL